MDDTLDNSKRLLFLIVVQHGKRQLTESQRLQEEYSIHRRGSYQQLFQQSPTFRFTCPLNRKPRTLFQEPEVEILQKVQEYVA